jgi:hypothetical protein
LIDLLLVVVLDYGYSYQDNYTLPALDSGLTGLPVEEGHTFTLQGLDVPIVEYRLACKSSSEILSEDNFPQITDQIAISPTVVGTPLVLFHVVKGDTVIPTSLLPQQSSQENPPNPEPHPVITPPPSPKISSQDSTTNSPQNGRLFKRAANSDKHPLYHPSKPDEFPGRLPNQFRGLPLLGSIKPFEQLQRWKPRHACVSVSSS